MRKINEQNIHNKEGSDSAARYPTANFYFTGKACHLERSGLKIKITGLCPDIRIAADVNDRTLTITIPRPAEIENLQFKKGSVYVKLPGLTLSADTEQYCGLRFVPMSNGDLRIVIPIPQVIKQTTNPRTPTAAVHVLDKLQQKTPAGEGILAISEDKAIKPVLQAHKRTKKSNNPNRGEAEVSTDLSGGQPLPVLSDDSAKAFAITNTHGRNINQLYKEYRQWLKNLDTGGSKTFGSDADEPIKDRFIRELGLYAENIARTIIQGANKQSDILFDAVQDSIVQVLTKLDTFHEDSLFSTWTYTVVANICRALARKGQRKVQTIRESEFCDTPNGMFLDTISKDYRIKDNTHGWTSSHNTDCDESRAILSKALNSLSPLFHPLVMLKLRGYSYEEIANDLQIKIGTVRSRLNRAKIHLKEQLALAGVKEIADIK